MKELKFTIVTPTLNQAHYIEDTIHSVLNQNYSNFEHIIVDGGSTDGTIDILKKYKHLRWISEKDNGQSNAINKGFNLATGDIIAWLNSDDYYENDIFKKIAEYFSKNDNCKFIYGDITYIDKYKNVLFKVSGDNVNYKNLIRNPDIVRQPSSFWAREIIEKIGPLNEDLHLAMDYDYILKIAKKFKLYYISENLSYYRVYNETKTISLEKKQICELFKVVMKNANIKNPIVYKYFIGRLLNAADDKNFIKRILTPLRKKIK
ncbi:MAG: glycosyltransferase family 2 protein [Bacteroidota bacterium]|nr:glycosyltransferase family 2 protein [Bacteroidota bacterium]